MEMASLWFGRDLQRPQYRLLDIAVYQNAINNFITNKFDTSEFAPLNAQLRVLIPKSVPFDKQGLEYYLSVGFYMGFASKIDNLIPAVWSIY